MKEQLQFLLQKYSVEGNVTLKNRKTVVLDGTELPLLAHRSERRIIELRNLVTGGTLTGISVMRVARIVTKGSDLYEELYRELDICEFVLGRTIRSIMVMENANVMNVLAKTEDGVVCTLELSATLKKGEPAKDKHEVIAQRGIACDIVVDAQLRQNSIYVFGKENQAYTDVDFELYGLSQEEISVVRAAFNLARTKNTEEVLAIDRHLNELIAAAKKSAKSGEREEI